MIWPRPGRRRYVYHEREKLTLLDWALLIAGTGLLLWSVVEVVFGWP